MISLPTPESFKSCWYDNVFISSIFDYQFYRISKKKIPFSFVLLCVIPISWIPSHFFYKIKIISYNITVIKSFIKFSKFILHTWNTCFVGIQHLLCCFFSFHYLISSLSPSFVLFRTIVSVGSRDIQTEVLSNKSFSAKWYSPEEWRCWKLLILVVHLDVLGGDVRQVTGPK